MAKLPQQLTISDNTFFKVWDGEEQYTKEFRVLDLANFIGGGGLTLVDISAADFAALEELSPNTLYKVEVPFIRAVGADVPQSDERVYVYTDSEGILNPYGYRTMRIPIFANTLGVYNEYSGATQGEYYIWGGVVWEALDTGSFASGNDVELDAQYFSLVSTDDTDFYRLKTFKCTYDRENMWVSSQEDEQRNIVGVGYTLESNFIYNPCDVTDWFYGDSDVKKMCNNSATFGLFNIKCSGVIVGNSVGLMKTLNVVDVVNNVGGINLANYSNAPITLRDIWNNEYIFEYDFDSNPLAPSSSVSVGWFFYSGAIHSIGYYSIGLTDGNADTTNLEVSIDGTVLSSSDTLANYNAGIAELDNYNIKIVNGSVPLTLENMSGTETISGGLIRIFIKILN